MKFKPTNYVPKKNKINWVKVLIIFIVVIVVSSVLQIAKNYEVKEEINYYGVCGLNDRQTRELIEDSYNDRTMKISDYLFYGETLSLYESHHVLNQSDEMYGKTVILKNLCTQNEYLYILEKQVDGQIPLEDLDNGFYTVSIVEDLYTKQLYFEEPFIDEFYTISRNETNKKISFIANEKMFNNQGDTENYLKENMLYLLVEEEVAPNNIVDVVIDPGHFSNDAGNYVEKGIIVGDRTEAEETYKIAGLVASELEKVGLKVLLTRNSSTDIVDSYGVNGRLYKGYDAKAKYYIDIQMKSASNPSIRGTQVVYSSFSSNRFAQTVYNEIINGTSLVSSGNGSLPGVVSGGLLDGYDGRMMLRESGGRILGAGSFSELSREENASFAADNRLGMQAITIEYAYMTNSEDMNVWDSELEQIAKKTADGIIRYIGLEN